MIFNAFQDKTLPLLGFGTMRLPTHPDGTIDEAQVAEMTRVAMENGVNYFDTAYPYHAGESERVIGRVLKAYPRDSYFLATKYPGHQLMRDGHNPALVFEDQLKKCGVEYFDFYLLHNVYERSMDTYLDPKWGIIDYFREQKQLGRIKHLGFSTHAETKGLEDFLKICGEDMEFCQIQLNYLDWTLQDAKGKYDLLTKWNIPVWVMEPVRGGKLAQLSPAAEASLRAFRPDVSIASWCFRFLQELPNVKMVLSGMSNMEQMQDNIRTFRERQPLNTEELDTLLRIADSMQSSLPCTACRYCCDGCPKGLDIPNLIAIYNEIRYSPDVNSAMHIEFLPEEKKPSACIACGKCSQICPQNIDIPEALKDLNQRLAKIASWEKISYEREEIAKKTRT